MTLYHSMPLERFEGFDVVVFDLGGPLFPKRHLHISALEAACRSVLGREPTRQERRAAEAAFLRGVATDVALDRAFAGLAPAVRRELCVAKRRLMDDQMASSVLPVASTQTLVRLMDRMIVAVVSLGTRKCAVDILERSGVSTADIIVLGRSDDLDRITKTQLLAGAIRCFSPDWRVLFVGDTPVDEEAANRLGVAFAHFDMEKGN